MKSLLLTLVSIFISSSVHAQIAGTVLGEKSHPLGYANVALYSLTFAPDYRINLN